MSRETKKIAANMTSRIGETIGIARAFSENYQLYVALFGFRSMQSADGHMAALLGLRG